jgi:FlaA1/EpsC-like NDP-sugar epimerase
MKRYRSFLLFGLDLLIISMVYVLATLIRFDFGSGALIQVVKVAFLLPRIILVYALIFVAFKLHKSLWTTSSLYEAIVVSFAVILSASFLWLINMMVEPTLALMVGEQIIETLKLNIAFNDLRIPNGVHLIAMVLNITLLNFARFSYRSYRFALKSFTPQKQLKRALIFGAGEAGQMMLREILKNPEYPYKVVGFADDDRYKYEGLISGIPVLGNQNDLCGLVHKHQIDLIIVAIPSANLQRQRTIIQKAFKCGVDVFTLHGSKAMLSKGDIMKSFTKISIEDVLGRNEVKLNNDLIEGVVSNKVVLVTGAAGSIGSELVRQIAALKPKLLVGIDINENELYTLEQALKIKARQESIEIPFIPLIASIRDKDNLFNIMDHYKVDVLFHAAAHKHVPLMETAYLEAIKNNVLGTYKLFNAAIAAEVPLVVSISTDKAVNPTNIMGASKRLVEMMAQTLGKGTKTKIVSVRFGNVLGSNGSVIPLFTKQIESGGPVTVTHPDMIRYFMSIPEAVSLVLQASSYGEGGEIFVLDMGEPVRIVDLAKNMIRLAGFKEEDIAIEFTGLRPGEKLYEELLLSDEGLKETSNDLIYVARPLDLTLNTIQAYISKLECLVVGKASKSEVINVLSEMIPTFNHKENTP